MENSDSLVVVAILIYFIAVLTIGFIYAKRSNSSASEYFLGGRKVGPWFTALSAEASDMSGYLLMGLPGLAFFTGAGEAGWTAVGLAIGTYLNWRFVAKRLRRYSVVANDSITLPGFYSNRFHDSKNIVGTIAAVIILLFFCVYTGSCFVTCGKLFHTLFGWDYSVMMVFGALIVFMYTMVGGYLSVVATDFVQGCLMFFALLVVVIGSITMAGGVQATAAFLSDIPGFLSATSVATPLLDESGAQMAMDGTPLFDDPTPFGILTIISTLSWGLGYFGMPQVLVRFLGIRSEEEVKQSRIIAVIWVVISMLAAVLIGLIGRKALPMLLGGAVTSSSAESIFIMLSQVMLPAFMCGIVVSGILAASMSSASSYLLITGSSVAENIFRGIFKKNATDEQVLIVSRITLTVVLLFGILVAWNEDSVIFTVVSYAWAGLGASFGPLTLFSLYWKRTTKQGAIAGMLTGAATVLIWHNFIKPLGGVFGIYELLPAFLLSCLAIYVVSKLTPTPSQEILSDFDRYENHDVSKERNMEVVLEDGMTLND
mgnify:CR=1 FL=1